ncbi:MAG: hypothetical protein GX597_01330 [Anaerolineaceae bacterium]|nr:hypothetical protein [Anaerolineaceae bacterium]
MKPWLRAPASLPGFPRITAMAVAEGPATGAQNGRPRTAPVHPALQAGHLQQLARRARSPFILVHPTGAVPHSDWLGAALELMEGAPDLAAISGGAMEGGQRPRPTLCLDAGAMLARRSALVHSGGLARTLQGQGDGLDLAWRLWAMGQRVVSLPVGAGPGPFRPAGDSCSVYQAHWSWLQILVRNCEEEVLGRAFSSTLLRLMAAAGEAAEQTAVPCREGQRAADPAAPGAAIQHVTALRRDPAASREPRYRVSRGAGEMLVAVHDATLLLPSAFDQRKQVQALRRVPDAEIEARIGRPPLEVVEEQMAALGRAALQAEMTRAGEG